MDATEAMDAMENHIEVSSSRTSVSPEPQKMTLEAITNLMAKYGGDVYLNALPSADSMTWIESSEGEESPTLVVGSIYSRNVLAYMVPRGDGVEEVRYCLKHIGDGRPPSTLEQITCEELLQKPLVAPFRDFACGSNFKKRVLSMTVRYYFLSRGYLGSIDAWNDDFAKRYSAMLRKMSWICDGRPVLHRTMAESPEPEDADDAYDFPSDGGNGELNIARSNVAEQQNSIVETSTRWNNESNPDLRCLREYLEQHHTLYLLDNIPDADDVKFVDQTYILEAQPKKLFVGSHAKSGDDIYAYMVMLQQRGFHEIRFYVETANGYKTMLPAETTGKQRLLHPFSKTYPKTAGPSEPADRARFTLMIKWYFIAAGVATDCVLRETKNYPGRFRSALEYIADQLGPAAVKPSNFIANGDAIPDDRSESSYAPDGIEVQPAPSREPRPKVPRFPLPYARKSAPSRNYVASMKSSTQLPHRKNSLTKTSTSEEIALLNVVPRNGKRSAEDETFENLTRMILQQSDLTAQLNFVDHDLDVMDARLEAFKAKWKREREELEKKRSQIEEERSAVRNLFKKQKLLDAQED